MLQLRPEAAKNEPKERQIRLAPITQLVNSKSAIYRGCNQFYLMERHWGAEPGRESKQILKSMCNFKMKSMSLNEHVKMLSSQGFFKANVQIYSIFQPRMYLGHFSTQKFLFLTNLPYSENFMQNKKSYLYVSQLNIKFFSLHYFSFYLFTYTHACAFTRSK